MFVNHLTKRALFGILLCGASVAFANQARDLGDFASNLAGSFPTAARLMIASCYISGIGLGLACAYKFKQYKDNPTQIPIGGPIALLIVSVLMIFAPGVIAPAGMTLFGTTSMGVAYLDPSQGESACGLPGSDGCA